MARHVKALKQANELEETRTRQEHPENQSQNEAGRPDVSVKMLQRTIAHPGQARPEHLRAVSQVYGNQAVMRLVEKARLERQVATASTVQRMPTQKGEDNLTAVQREENGNEELEAKKEKIKGKLKRAKIKETLLLGGRKTANMFKNLVMLPFKAIDQLSVVDLHIKDAIKYAKTKKTRKERDSEDHEKSHEDKVKSKFKRVTGRTGLTGYLHGFKSHSLMYGKGGSTRLPVLGSRFNPLNMLHNINGEGLKDATRDIKNLSKDLWMLENPGKKPEEMPGKTN